MNINEFLQYSAANPQPTPGPAPQGHPVQPTQGFNILEKGAETAINTARQALGGKKHHWTRPIFETMGDALTAQAIASPHAGMQALGKQGFNPYEAQDKKAEENLKIAQYLQKAEEARQYRLQRQEHMNEMARHHKASEERLGHHHGGTGRHGEFMVNEEGDPIQYISDMGEALKKKSIADVHQYTDKANDALEATETASRMIEIAEQHPEIMNSWGYIVTNKHNENPGFWTKAALDLGVPPEDSDLLMEMASLAKQLAVRGIKALPSKGMNMMVDKVILGVTPGAKLQPQTLVRVLKKAIPDWEHGYQEYNKGSEYGRRGIYYIPSARKAKERPATPEQHKTEAEAESGVTPIASMTEEQLMQRREQLRAMKAAEGQQ